MESVGITSHSTNFGMFHPQTTEIHPFKVEQFSTKTPKFQQDNVFIYDVSIDFGILFNRWNRVIMSYPCTKFHFYTIINNGNFVYLGDLFYKRQRSQHNYVIIDDMSDFFFKNLLWYFDIAPPPSPQVLHIKKAQSN